ncbi:MAG: thymidine phosphorylase [Pyrinomonadaceae bacterium]
MRSQEIIAKKRDGGELSAGEINSFIDGVCDNTWADYQISALLMAMFTRGLNFEEQDNLTRSMLNSGDVLDFSDIDAPKADKHSTGGVGDKTSLIIAPLVAACGVAVPMISGRGLGHTGGTLDKLEAISGYNVKLSTDEFRKIIKKCGYAMAGQTAEIAPADKKIYALRDATATVPYIPLIVASIMSKKLAEGLDVLVLDVKTGSGAFMVEFEDSKKLAEALVKTGTNFGVRTEAVISDMSQPLGRFVGNSLEVYECINILKGRIDGQSQSTWDLSLELSARILVMSGIKSDIETARAFAQSILDSGAAFEKFRMNVECQGGDTQICDNSEMLLNQSLIETKLVAPASGFIANIDTLAIGNSIVAIGGGRLKTVDKIDHAVGFANEVKVTQNVKAGDTLGILHSRSQGQADSISAQLANAYKITFENNQKPPLIQEIIVS